jgi:hypothetical protein
MKYNMYTSIESRNGRMNYLRGSDSRESECIVPRFEGSVRLHGSSFEVAESVSFWVDGANRTKSEVLLVGRECSWSS